jgi:hypothetical protein
MIVQSISSVVADLTPVTAFIYGLKGWQNLKADKSATFPIAFLDEPISSSDSFGKGGAVDIRYNIKMAFLTKSELAWTAEQHDVAIQEMRTLRRQFILRLKKIADPATCEHLFRAVDNVNTLNAMNVFDVNLTGVIVTFQLTPMSGDGICLTAAP